MRGRHIKKGSKKFLWDMVGLVGAVLVVAALVFVAAQIFLVDDENGGDTAAESTTTTETLISSSTSGTTAETTSSTTTVFTTTSTTTPPTTTTSALPSIREPAELTVQTLNANGQAGVAGRMTERLRAAGYLLLAAGNNESRLPTSQVQHREGYAAEAAELANQFIPDAELVADSGADMEADIIIRIGESFEESDT